MRFLILAVGRMKAGPESDLLARYCARVNDSGRISGFAGLDVREIEESRARRPQDRKSEEAAMLRAALPSGALICVLDERAPSLTSQAFADRMLKLRDEGIKSCVFIIGGADGLEQELLSQAHHKLSFGAMTMPHQLVRVLIAEQIYRATTIASGHPYHRV